MSLRNSLEIQPSFLTVMYPLCIAAIFFAPFAAAQDATQAIKAHFTQSGLVPDLFSSFEPTALLTLDFPGGVPFCVFHRPV